MAFHKRVLEPGGYRERCTECGAIRHIGRYGRREPWILGKEDKPYCQGKRSA